MDSHVAIVQDAGEGKGRRRWVELLAQSPRGARKRVVARTPVLYGDGEDADLRHRRAVAEAGLMCSGLNQATSGGPA